MLSAKSEGRIWISGDIPDPKSRDYICPDPRCVKPVSHVKEHFRRIRLGTTELTIPEHFRHEKDTLCPGLHYTWQTYDIMNHLLSNSRGLPWFEFETDKFYSKGLEFVVNMTVKDNRLTEENQPKSIETAVMVESGPFNSADFGDKIRCLSSQGIYSLLILSAQGVANHKGKYFRDEEKPYSRDDLKRIAGNEKEVYELFGRNVYFEHDKGTFEIVTFENHKEPLGEDPSDRCEDCDVERETYCTKHWFSYGQFIHQGYRDLETVKVPRLKNSLESFILSYHNERGILIAEPKKMPDYYPEIIKNLNSLKKAIGEDNKKIIDDLGADRIPILLEGNLDPLDSGPSFYYKGLMEKVEL